LARARGEWVIWLNADDIIVPGALAAVKPFLTSDYDVVYGDGLVIDQGGEVIKHYHAAPIALRRVIQRGCYVFSGSMLWRRSSLIELGGFREDLDYCMDFELLVRLALSTQRTLYRPTPIGALRWHGASKGARHPWRFFGEHWTVAYQATRTNPELRRAAAFGQARMAVYVATRRFRQSRLWRGVVKEKRL
jgi:GT2 family glycosyltransferase